jgi:hypothetical protein
MQSNFNNGRIRSSLRNCAGLLAGLSLSLSAVQGLAASAPIDPALPADEIRQLTKEAFFWGMQQAGFYELRYQFTQNERSPAFRGVNRVQRNRKLFTAKQRFATTPNASTLYSGGTFDLSQEPIMIDAAAVTEDRYWSIQAADQYAHWFFFVGSPFTGNQAQQYLIIGPDWKGKLPAQLRATQIIRAPSNAMTMTLRLAVKNAESAEDLAAAGKIMDGVFMAPLSLWEKNGGHPATMDKQPVVKGEYRTFARMAEIGDLTRSMTAIDYLQLTSLVINDSSMTKRSDSLKEVQTLQRLTRLGLREGYLFDPEGLTAEQKQAIEQGFHEARSEARRAVDSGLLDMNGWKLQTSLFYSENDYVLRAGAAEIAWGSPVPFESHTIGFGMVDAEGKTLDSRHTYTLTFDMDKLPPVTDFWEMPLYDDYGYFVDNPINRYSVTSYQLKNGSLYVHDGKLTLYLQRDRPKDASQARNWLPTPAEGIFRLAPRFYGPTAPLIDGSYAMPKIVRVK